MSVHGRVRCPICFYLFKNGNDHAFSTHCFEYQHNVQFLCLICKTCRLNCQVKDSIGLSKNFRRHNHGKCYLHAMRSSQLKYLGCKDCFLFLKVVGFDFQEDFLADYILSDLVIGVISADNDSLAEDTEDSAPSLDAQKLNHQSVDDAIRNLSFFDEGIFQHKSIVERTSTLKVEVAKMIGILSVKTSQQTCGEIVNLMRVICTLGADAVLCAVQEECKSKQLGKFDLEKVSRKRHLFDEFRINTAHRRLAFAHHHLEVMTVEEVPINECKRVQLKYTRATLPGEEVTVKPISFYMVRFKEMFTKLLSDPNIIRQLKFRSRTEYLNPGFISDFQESPLIKEVKNHILACHPNIQPWQIFHFLLGIDDATPGDSKSHFASSQNQMMCYLKMVDWLPSQRCIDAAMHTLAISYVFKGESERQAVLNAIFSDLAPLLYDGIEVWVPEENSYIRFFPILVAILSDGKGQREILNFKAASATYQCVTCNIQTHLIDQCNSEEDLNKLLRDYDETKHQAKMLRDTPGPESWQKNFSTATGINGYSKLWDFGKDLFDPRFQVVQDPMHILGQGIIPEMIAIAADVLESDGFMNREDFEQMLTSHSYDKRLIPPFISVLYTTNDQCPVKNSIGLNAMPTINLLLYLPMLIMDKIESRIDGSHQYILLVILGHLVQIVIISLSPVLFDDDSTVKQLKWLIFEFHKLFVQHYSQHVCKDKNGHRRVIIHKNRPKSHGLEHEGEQVRLLGPPRFHMVNSVERMHQLLKSTKMKNRRNIPCTQMRRFQLTDAINRKNNAILDDSNKYEYGKCVNKLEGNLLRHVLKLIKRNSDIDLPNFAAISNVHCCKYNGNEYRVGDVLMAKVYNNGNYPIFVRIESIFRIDASKQCVFYVVPLIVRRFDYLRTAYDVKLATDNEYHLVHPKKFIIPWPCICVVNKKEDHAYYVCPVASPYAVLPQTLNRL